MTDFEQKNQGELSADFPLGHDEKSAGNPTKNPAEKNENPTENSAEKSVETPAEKSVDFEEKIAEKSVNFDAENAQASQAKPRPVIQRILAWLGIVYVVISMLLVWANLITGSPISGIGPLMTVPALIGFGALLIFRRKEAGKPPLNAGIILAELVIIFLIIFAFYVSLPVLFSQL